MLPLSGPPDPNPTPGGGHMDIVRVSEKLNAFRSLYEPTEYAIKQWSTEDVVGSTSRVTGHCQIIDVATGVVLSEASGTRALREPIPGAQGHKDTRDPERAMTQALGRALGLFGFADANGIEGDTDEPDDTGVNRAAPPPPQPPHPSTNPATAARAKLRSAPEPTIDTAGLKGVLNDLDAADRKKVRAALEAAGLPTTLPDQMTPQMFDEVEALVDNLEGAS